MKKTHIFTLIAVMVSLNVWGQNIYPALNYDSLTFGKQPRPSILSGTTINTRNIWMPNIQTGTPNDNVLTIRDGKVFWVPRSTVGGVTSVNGRTGAVTGLAELNVDNNFSGNQLIVGNQDIIGYQKIAGSSEINGPLVLKDVFSLQRNGNILIEGNVNSLGENISVGSLALSYQNLSNRSTVFIKPSFSTNQTINLDLPTAGGTLARLEDITGAGASYELLANKSTTLASPNNTTYPTTLAVSNAIAGITPTVPTLQQVLTAGNTSDKELVITKSGNAMMIGANGSGLNNSWTFRGTNRDWYFGVGQNEQYYFGSNQGPKWFFTKEGLFGVNNETPTVELDVVGKALVSVAPTVSTGVLRLGDVATGQTIGARATGTTLQDVTNAGNIIESSIPTIRLKTNQTGAREYRLSSAYYDEGSLSVIDVTAGNESRLQILSNGNIGIGMITPSAKLDVNGSARASLNDGNANTLVRNTDLSTYAKLSSNNSFTGDNIFGGMVKAGTIESPASISVKENTSTWASLARQGSISDPTNKSNGVIQLSRANSNGTGSNFTGTISRPDIDAAYNWVLPAESGILSLGTKQIKTASGNGSATTIVIPHGLANITSSSYVIAVANNAASAGINYVTVDATNVSIFYTVAPASGTNNLKYSIEIK